MSETHITTGAAAPQGITPAPGAAPFPQPPPAAPQRTLGPAQWGMLAFLLSEVAFFSTLIVTYIFYIGKDRVGPTPAEALSLRLVLGTTACLLLSSVTVHFAERALRHGTPGGFRLLWGLTILLGVLFLAGTGYEWYDLITKHHLTIGRNLFGTTFFTLVGFHGLHVTAGVVTMLIVLGLALAGRVTAANPTGPEVVSWYWHFVDGVWVVVFTMVYLVGR
ncbi:MAG TPA: heme-copper oxidase subunit III [Gemmataceae bacterium]|nr:heme-copper oxidase subunit III [Gemmataceae bacterium]